MSKFKVGDIVVGNAGARNYYYTTEGSVLKVLEPDRCEGIFKGQIITSPKGSEGRPFVVREEHFDLKDAPTETSTQTTEELVEECASLKEQIKKIEEKLNKKKAFLASNRDVINKRINAAY